MRYPYYPYSCERIRQAIHKKYPGAGELAARSPELDAAVNMLCRTRSRWVSERVERVIINHLLWMLDRMQTMVGNDAPHAAKRGRWMGWVYAYCEWMGLFTQRQIRNMARRDSHAGTV